MATGKPVKLTPARLKELHDEMTWMKTVREKEVAEMIKEARSFGDLSENSEYDEAKDQQGKLFSREAEVQAILDNYVLIDETVADNDIVGIGVTVRVYDKTEEEEVEYRIVGSQEADPMNGKISEESLFGKAILGKRVGEIVKVETLDGEVDEYEVLSITAE